MPALKDYTYLIGQKIGKLTVGSEEYRGSSGKRALKCFCDCGNEKIIKIAHLVRALKEHSQGTRSCGCLIAQHQKEWVLGNIIHGKTNNYMYNTWKNMKVRCYAPSYRQQSTYRDRGILVCERWKSFTNFYNDILSSIGERPSTNMSLDRVDNDKGYEPGNVRWANRHTQCNNKVKSIKFIFGNCEMSIVCWANFLGEKYWKLMGRYKRDTLSALIKQKIAEVNFKANLDLEALSTKGTPYYKINNISERQN